MLFNSRMFDRFRFDVQCSFLGNLCGCLRKKKSPAAKSLHRRLRYTDRELLAELQAAASVQSHKRILVSTSNETACIVLVVSSIQFLRLFLEWADRVPWCTCTSASSMRKNTERRAFAS